MTKWQPQIAGSTICGLIDPSTGWACSRIGRHDEHVAFEDHDEESEELARWPSELVERNRKLAAEQAEERLNAAAPQLLSSLKEMRDVAAACYRLITESTDEHLMTDLEIELRRIEIADGFGKRADEAVRLAEKGKP